jgi:hypothetical protein
MDHVEVFKPALGAADAGGIHRRQVAQFMAGTGLMRGQRHHDAPFGNLKTRRRDHDALEGARGDHRHLEGQEVGQVEGRVWAWSLTRLPIVP